MKHLFASREGALRRRWKVAFPQAAVIALARSEQCVRQLPGNSLVWLACPDSLDSLRAPLAAALAAGNRVVVMSGTPAEAEAFQALKAGASAYCHLEAAPEQLREIALVVGHGGLWMPPGLVQRLLALSLRTAPAESAAAVPDLAALTAREREVAAQVAQGASNSEIAAALGITGRTVKAHLSAVFAKLGVRDRVQLALAMRAAGAGLEP
ncbi:MAG: response regulator transcription factor [Haliea sp.]|uniref:response regulator transcription factor n=1 Tax=Haliea sp. TaxID=1932666 RepID=UPI0032EE9E74